MIMKRITTLLFFMFCYFFVFGQMRDVIVLTQGDSIACTIVHIDEEKINYNMLHNDRIVNTYSKRKLIKAYYKDHTSFKVNARSKGSSILSDSLAMERKLPFYRKNVICLEVIYFIPGIYYERRIPLSEKAALGLSAGAFGGFYFDGLIASIESKIVLGGPKHFFDIALGTMAPLIDFFGRKQQTIVGTLSYQYTAKKGFTFKIGGGLLMYWPIVKLGIGYNF